MKSTVALFLAGALCLLGASLFLLKSHRSQILPTSALSEETVSEKTGRVLELERSPSRMNIVVREGEPDGQRRECLTSECGCIEDYTEFLRKAENYAKPRSDGEIEKRAKELQNEPPVTKFIPENELAVLLARNLNIGFLLDGIDSRPLTVFSKVTEKNESFVVRELVFRDSFVGEFRAVRIEPAKIKKFPTVIGLHGHSQSPEDFLEMIRHRDFIDAGIGLLVLSSRAICGQPREDESVRALMRDGFNLMGLHIYELALALGYLTSAGTDGASPGHNQKFGLIGHSSGSTTGNAAVRVLAGRFAAYVSDQDISYIEDDFSMSKALWINIVPELYPMRLIINDQDLAETKTLPLPYGYIQGPYDYRKEILGFFKSALK